MRTLTLVETQSFLTMEVSLQAPKKKRSPIWDYFVISDYESFAKCCSCELKVSRGGKDTKTYGTTNLSTHLRIKHPELLKEFEKKSEELKLAAQAREGNLVAKKRQLSLQECDDRVRQWNINDDRSQRIHKRIGEMIALDCHPFSLVEDEGFTRLLRELEPRYSLPSRRYFTENI